jgi:hypothetical protein
VVQPVSTKELTVPEYKNKTSLDAFQRVNDARLGALVDATDDYLLALQHELAKFSARVQEELSRRVQANIDFERAQAEEDDSDCDYLYDGPGGISDREDFHSDG